uniref:Uncharacterized protein n=1 Tax=Brassica oleracea TaxID=3712 RepID=A0A3P6FGD4_BRAOL|nr:unnamed protein product [Brassica oleracea]
MGKESDWNVNYDDDAVVEALPAPAHKKKKKTPVETPSVETLGTVEEVVGEPFGEQPDGEADGQPDAEAVGQPYG